MNEKKIIENYFNRFGTKLQKIDTKPQKNLELTVVIPAYNEPEIHKTINCLLTQQIDFFAEIIVVINHPNDAPQNAKNQNYKTYQELKEVSQSQINKNINIYPLFFPDLPKKISGVGYARKLGFDQALNRLATINNYRGIIVSLDADTLCDKNYLKLIKQFYRKNPKTIGTTICFEHPTDTKKYPKDIIQAIILYELYIRYYVQALREANFPMAYHTIGSAFTVRADIYASQGGMPTAKAGEDFYFLQKIIPLKGFREIKNTKVYPSPRITDRVPFGTGVAVKQIIKQNFKFFTYNYNVFKEIKIFLTQIKNIYYQKQIYGHTKTIDEFLKKNNFHNALENMLKNSASFINFKKRFFRWFNSLMVLKFLNFAHSKFYKKIPIEQAAMKLLKEKNINTKTNQTKELLNIYRNIQQTEYQGIKFILKDQ